MAPDDSDLRDDSRARRRLRDPYLLLLVGLRRGLHALGAFYEWFEERPSWLRLLFGVAASLLSAYFGEAIRKALDQLAAALLTPVAGEFVQFPLWAHIALSLLVLLSIQSAVTNRNIVDIVDTLNTVESEAGRSMGRESEPATDGGQQPAPHDVTVRTNSRSGAFLGAVFGVTLGGLLGPSPMIGGLVGGAIIGNEIENYALRRRRA